METTESVHTEMNKDIFRDVGSTFRRLLSEITYYSLILAGLTIKSNDYYKVCLCVCVCVYCILCSVNYVVPRLPTIY